MTTERDWQVERWRMLERIRAEVRLTRDDTGMERLSPAVLNAMARVPRHRFVPARYQDLAYADTPLPIGHGQTISQPFIVALMTELLTLGEGAQVLEVGTGCGYQTAVLAELAERIFSLELVEPLAQEAARRLAELGYANVEVRQGDGYLGWPERAPFDGIIVTAGAPRIPEPLVEQLRPGGRLVIPVERGFGQELVVMTKGEDGEAESRDILPVAFVPLLRG